MYIVTRMKTTADPIPDSETGELVAVTELDDVHIEENVDDMLERLKLGDHRMTGIRIFHMGVDDDGVPSIGTEVSGPAIGTEGKP